MKAKRFLIVAAVSAAALASGGWLLQRDSNGGTVYRQAQLFDVVLAHVADYYVDSIDERQLYQNAIDGMLDKLHDPYTVYMKPDQFSVLNEQTTGNYGGLGIQIDVRDGWITVVAPLPDTPAEHAGVLTGDRIVALDGKSTEGWKQDHAVKELRGQAGSNVTLSVKRIGVDQPLTFKLTRATIHVRSVPLAMMLDDRVGYVQLSPVSETSAPEMQAAVDSLVKKGMKSLILDLRGNPGGLLDQAIKVSDLFLDPGQVVVEQRGRAPGATQTYRDRAAQQWPNLPIVILVNGGTASAAEIISGALQDHDRALIVGTPTFGKGLVQSLFRLTDSTALKMTTARWYTPSGRTIQRKSKDELDQEAHALALETAPDTAAVDSTQTFKTDRGRVVFGGGAIRPDLNIVPDTLSTAERTFIKVLGNKLPLYFDVRTGYALELKAAGRLTDRNFVVTDDMVSEVWRRLRAKGATLPDSALAGGRTLIRQQLGYEVARYVFGRPAEFRREVGDDRQIQEALGLARRARSPQDLLAIAAATPQPNKN